MYLIDKNLLTKEILNNTQKMNGLCLLQEVIDEAGFSKEDVKDAKKNKINILEMSLIHLEKMQNLMATYGSNLKLINLFKNQGTADVAIIAFVLGEKERNSGLFNLEYSIVTKDNAIIELANKFDITTIQDHKFLNSNLSKIKS